jgi:hypothetical protein
MAISVTALATAAIYTDLFNNQAAGGWFDH